MFCEHKNRKNKLVALRLKLLLPYFKQLESCHNEKIIVIRVI